MKSSLVFGLIAAAFATHGQQAAESILGQHNAAFYSGDIDEGGYGTGLQSLVVFPNSGNSFTIRLPFAIGYYAQNSNGKVLYAEAIYDDSVLKRKTPTVPEGSGIFRIELESMDAQRIPGSADIVVFSMALSSREDKLVVSGRLRREGRRICGLFDVFLTDGAIKPVIETSDCEYLSSWSHLSVSPDGERAVANHRGSLEVIDLRTKAVRRLGPYDGAAEWSPDGAWLAVAEDRGTAILDAKTLKKHHQVGVTYAKWSPDSRFLLGGTSRGCPGGYFWTLQAVDAMTGKRQTIDSSKCKINRGTLTWTTLRER